MIIKMKKVIAAAASAAIAAVSICPVLAAQPTVSVSQPTVEGSKITISGTLRDGYINTVAYYVVSADGDTNEKYAIGEIYINSEDGSFCEEFRMSDTAESGRYSVVLASVKSSESAAAEYDYISAAERLALTEYITSAQTSSDDALAALEEEQNKDVLRSMACIIDDYSSMSETLRKSAVTLIKSDLNGYFSAPYTEDKFVELFNYAVAYTAAVTDTAADTAEMLKKYENIFGIDTSGIVPGDYLTRKIRAAEAVSTDSVRKVYNDACAVIAFNNEIDYKNIPALIEKYKDIIGLELTEYSNTLSDSGRVFVWQAMIGGNYDTAGDIKTKLNSAVADAKAKGYVKNSGGTAGGNGGGGGGGSSSGSGGGGTSIVDGGGYVPAGDLPKQTEGSFTDLDGYSWAEEAITALAKSNVISGVDSQHFEPSRGITREEFIKILVCAFSLVDASAVCSFEDVAAESWYYVYVASAVENGIVKGVSGTEFGTGAPVTRQEIAVLLTRTADSFGIVLGEQRDIDFEDSAEFDEYAAESIVRLAKAGIINGKDGGRFAPRDNANRAEAAKMIWEVWKKANA